MNIPVDLLATLFLGLITGWGASRLMGSGHYGVIGDVALGVLGAFVGGWLPPRLLGIEVTGLNLTSVAISVVCAAFAIAFFRAMTACQRWFA